MAQKLKFGNGTWANKEGSTLAYNDENNNYKPLPFSFTRDSIATRVNKEGLIEVVGKDKPRIDYTDSSDGVLLLEPSRTNQMTNSEDFTSWTKQGATTISLENISNPVNSTNANLITVDSNGVYANRTTPNASSVYAISFWLYKNNNIGNIVLDNAQGGANGQWEINLDLLPNSFVRIDKSHPSVNVLYEFKTLSSGDIAPFFKSPEGTKSFYVTGFQLEQGSYPTSYIPTSGSSVQRAAETCNGAGNSEVFNDSEGVLFADISALSDSSDNRVITLSDGTTSNRVQIYFNSSNGITGGVANQASISYSTNIEISSKVAFKYKTNDFALWVSGFKIGTDVIGSSPNGLKEIDFDNGANGSNYYGKTKEIGYYDTALTDEELEYITSYRSLNELVTELNLNTL